MTDLQNAVEKLTRPWSDVLSPAETGLHKYIPVDYPPMLDMLDEACRNFTSTRSQHAGGLASTQSLLNLEAHAVRERIDGTVRAWYSRLSKERCPRELKNAVAALAGVLQAHQAARTITDSEFARIADFFPRWCAQIWKLYDPPVVKELQGECPNPDCGRAKFDDGDSVGAALVAFYVRNTGSVRAKCRGCAWEWSSAAELRLLGEHLGAVQDVEFLDAVGI